MNFCRQTNWTVCTATNFKINVIRSKIIQFPYCVTQVKFDANKDNFVVWNKTNGEDGGNALGNCSTTKFDLTIVDLVVLAEKFSYVFKHLEFYIEKLNCKVKSIHF